MWTFSFSESVTLELSFMIRTVLASIFVLTYATAAYFSRTSFEIEDETFSLVPNH